MQDYVNKLRREVDAKIDRIESAEGDVLKKALEASHILGEAFDDLRKFIHTYTFKDEEEEILFFKEIKPKFCYRLIVYRKIYNIEMNRPAAGIEAQYEYLHRELDAINQYTLKRLDFIRYYRSGSTHLDSMCFVRYKQGMEQYLETFCYELDPHFSTNCDFKVAKILANDMLSSYLMHEIEQLADTGSFGFPATKLTWKGTKTELMEQIVAWDSAEAFGDVPLTQLYSYMQNVFNVRLDSNLSRSFSEMKIRNTPAPFLDKLKDALLKKMGRK